MLWYYWISQMTNEMSVVSQWMDSYTRHFFRCNWQIWHLLHGKRPGCTQRVTRVQPVMQGYSYFEKPIQIFTCLHFHCFSSGHGYIVSNPNIFTNLTWIGVTLFWGHLNFLRMNQIHNDVISFGFSNLLNRSKTVNIWICFWFKTFINQPLVCHHQEEWRQFQQCPQIHLIQRQLSTRVLCLLELHPISKH